MGQAGVQARDAGVGQHPANQVVELLGQPLINPATFGKETAERGDIDLVFEFNYYQTMNNQLAEIFAAAISSKSANERARVGQPEAQRAQAALHAHEGDDDRDLAALAEGDNRLKQRFLEDEPVERLRDHRERLPQRRGERHHHRRRRQQVRAALLLPDPAGGLRLQAAPLGVSRHHAAPRLQQR